MSKLGDIWIQLGLKKQGFDKGLKDAQNSTKTFGSNIGKALTSAAGKFLTVAAAVKVLGDSVKSLAQFERANSTLASVLGTTSAGIKELTNSAKDLGRQTEFTSSQVTQLQTELARLGFVKSDILDMQESVLKFAAAVGTDLASAASFAGGSLRTFGLSTKDTQDMLDIMADSTSKSALSFSKLETSMGIVFPIAKTFGLSVADTVAMLGALNNVMPDASMAATAFRNILLNLADSNGKLAQGLGHTAKTFPEIVAALEELSARGVDLNEVLGMSDKRSAAALASFIQNTKALKDLRQAFDDSTGSVDRMYETMTNNLIGSVRALKSAWEGLVLTWQSSTGPMKSVVDWLTTMINKLTDLNTAAQTGNKSRKDKDEENDLWSRFKYIGDTQGKEEMISVFNQWLKDAKAAYDRAIDAYNNHKSRKNKKAMTEHGNYVMNLSDISQKVMSYEPSSGAKTNNALVGSAPTGSGRHQLTDEEKDQIKSDRKQIENIKIASKDQNEALAARYAEQLALFRKYGEDTSELTDKFNKDLVSNLNYTPEKDNLEESVMDKADVLRKHYDEIKSIMESFGLDTTDLTQKFNLMLIDAVAEDEEAINEADQEVQESSNSMLESFEALNGLDLDPATRELLGFAAASAVAAEQTDKAIEHAKYLAEEFNQNVAGGFADACQELMDQLTGVSEANAGAVVKALIEPLADMAIREGEVVLAAGIGIKALKTSLETLSGPVAIAAGAALIAIGAAAKSGLAALASTGSTSTTVSSYGGSSAAQTQNVESEMTIYVKGTLKGSDIVLAGERTVNSWSR